MNDDELELKILRRYADHYKQTRMLSDKCARELGMRDIVAELTGVTGDELDFATEQWVDRLAGPIPAIGPARSLRRCSNGELYRGPHRYHARAYEDAGRWPAWDRMQELEEATALTRNADKQIVVNIHDSVVGNVNLAPVLGDLNASVSALSSEGQEELATLIKELVERIPKATALSPEQQRQALELVSTLSQEMAKELPRRPSATVQLLRSTLGPLLSRAAELATIWQAIEPHLTKGVSG